MGQSQLEKKQAYNKAYNAKNKEKRKLANQKYNAKNKESILSQQSEYRAQQREIFNNLPVNEQVAIKSKISKYNKMYNDRIQYKDEANYGVGMNINNRKAKNESYYQRRKLNYGAKLTNKLVFSRYISPVDTFSLSQEMEVARIMAERAKNGL